MSRAGGLEAALADEAARLGFASLGIAAADAAPQAAARLRGWLEAGHHGDMLWMAETEARRGSPKALWPEVRSVVMLGTRYAPALDPLRHAERAALGVISVYALGQDYHDTIKKRLKALARWLVGAAPEAGVKVFVDTAAVMEKPLAEAAGLGWQGKHTNLVSRDHGSWLFLGALYTTLDLVATPVPQPRCGSCRRCLEACPTDAFPEPYRLDARRCISYLTIEHKGPIPHEFRRAIGNRIYGCDDCLAVCPWNRFARAAADFQGLDGPFQPRAELTAPRLADLLQLDETAFRALFSGSPVKRIGRSRMVRNAAIAAGNSGDRALVPVLGALRADADAVVAEAAGWAVSQLGG
jgi:epoxyqueuosine reductase